ncbi:MAG: hypothetical protein MUD03_13430 [Pirellula sp.]|nr:hypothetical protein [Pirellula sp.]
MSSASAIKAESTRTDSRSVGSTEKQGDFDAMVESIGVSIKEYGSKHPGIVACSIFLAGFYVGWKIKPW